jgi:hypothetical protein
MKIKYFLIVLLFLPILSSNFTTNAQSDWNFNAGLYGWCAGMTGTIGVASKEQQIKSNLNEILKDLTFAAGLHFEAQNTKVVLIFDSYYFGVKKDVDQITLEDGSTYTPNAYVNLDEWWIEGSVGYRITPEFDILAATRVFIINTDLESDNDIITSANKSWLAFYLGGRYLKNFSGKWYASIRADAGYGADGFVYYANAAVGYRFSKLFSLALAYKIMSVNYNSGLGTDYFLYDVTASGLGLGLDFSF